MNRPYIIINCAMSSDGKLALPNRRQLRISNDEDMKRVYQLRNTCDAVLVGIGTVLSDDPKLTVKEKYVQQPCQPTRIVLDTHCRTPETALVVNEKAKTIVVTGEKCKKFFNSNVETIQCRTDNDGKIDLYALLEMLYERGIKRLIVEGGSNIIWSFIKNKFFDDLFVYIGPMIVGGAQTPSMADGGGIKNIDDLIHLEIKKFSRLGSGILINYKLKNF